MKTKEKNIKTFTMKRLLFTAIIGLLFMAGSLNAQWIELDSGYESPWILFDNSFPAGQNDVGFFAGMYTTNNGDGVILKTEDGGATFTTILGGDPSLFGIESIRFTTLDIGYAAGWDDDIKYTEDGGDTWSDMSVGTGVYYYTDIQFWDEDNGVISAKMNSGNDKIWYTEDGGDSWTEATGISIGIIAMGYADADNVFAVGSEEDIIKSSDGGKTWSLNHDGTDPDNDPLLGIHFYDADFGIVGGMDGKLKITTNGGSSWTTTQIASNYPSFYGVYCFNTDSAYVAGTDEIIYKTTDGGTTWSSMNGGGNSSLYQFSFTQNNTGYVSGSSGTILYLEAPLFAEFEADVTTTCTGSTVNFTDLSGGATSWSWTFEGGTPSTSTDQNPGVVYNTPGEYDVTLEVSDGTNTSTQTKADYITVLETPAKADTPDGDDATCTQMTYTYETSLVDYATDWEWEINPTDAGSLSWEDNFATFIADNSWTGDFTIRVRATNLCGDGEWSDELTVSQYISPDEFNLEGGGSYCLGDDGVEITLDGSQTDVDYELILDGVPTGNIVSGTGSEISFGLVTDEGFYSCVAYNDNCEHTMTGQLQVSIEFPPLEPAIPEGPESICDEATADYTTEEQDDADSFVWMLSPEEAGTISGEGTEATVTWDAEFMGTAYVSVYGVNDCGDGNPSEELEVSVGMPTPEVSGQDLVCDWSDEFYEVTENEGSTYTWTVTGGTITDGQGTYMITVAWEGEGAGTVAVEEETAGGCTGESETFDVVIDDCTDIFEAEAFKNVNVYPNPASQSINIAYTAAQGNSGDIVIYNTMGQVVFESAFTGNGSQQTQNIDLNNIPKGIYIISLQTDSGKAWRSKFEKTR
jgi:photosystem II stability/assembly factor-like uncharacterized protein